MRKNNSLSAVIDLGSSGIRLLIAEKRATKWKSLETLEKKSSLGRDVFNSEEISEQSFQQVVEILRLFREYIDSWNIPSSRIRCVATSAVREAHNRDMFIERVELHTGFVFQVLEAMEANLLTYRSVDHALRGHLRIKKSNALIVETSGGGTNVLMLNKGLMVGAHSLNLGSIRFEKELKSGVGTSNYLEKLLDQKTLVATRQFEMEFPLNKVKYFIALGSDIRRVSGQIGEKKKGYYLIQKDSFLELLEKISGMESVEVASEYGVPFSESGAFFATLQIYGAFFKQCAAISVIVPKVSIREGVLQASKRISNLASLEDEIAGACYSLAAKFGVDKKHSDNVALNALKIFDALAKVGNLDKDHRIYLRSAAVLMDVGLFIHHHHSQRHGLYLIRHSEIFGLNELDRIIVGLIVRYHGKTLPKHTHSEFSSLRRSDRLTVFKLSAILRVARALDIRLVQRLKVEGVETDANRLQLKMNIASISPLEIASLEDSSEIFQDVFGLKIEFAERS
ncbi:hypothetical protein PQO03_13290 [Lentisphaera profundi]|uniref:Ppx/GppA phosphatase domain-containing protein n=1 Tax=Lentisphaera profundi TaxID=1658616 RepID=A0ABY7VX57_9BACT|nr:hypothetical protein [Lentisphaera profundi]WDE98808.1 hypothetical protein PQO03_13290 [Lentisphaera profundi]